MPVQLLEARFFRLERVLRSDSIKPSVVGELCDWTWVDCGAVTSSTQLLKKLPYTRPGWYFRAAVAHLLDRAKITWSDCKLSFQATHHLDKNAFAPFLAQIQDAWAQTPSDSQAPQALRERGHRSL